MNLSHYAIDHYEWVVSVDWDNKRSPVEALGLLGSEIGEACNECRSARTGDNLNNEIADIILRLITLMIECCRHGFRPDKGNWVEYNRDNVLLIDFFDCLVEDAVSWCVKNWADEITKNKYEISYKNTPLVLLTMLYRPLGVLIDHFDDVEKVDAIDYRMQCFFKSCLCVAGLLDIDLEKALVDKIDLNRQKGIKPGRDK